MAKALFPLEAYKKKNYAVLRITLDSKPKTISIRGDYINVVSGFTTCDVSKVYIGINSPEAEVPLNEAIPTVTPFEYFVLRWEDSENFKQLVLLVGGELFTQNIQTVVIGKDLAGLAKDSTVANIANLTFDSAKNLKVSPANAEVAVPADLQARYKPPGMVIYSGTVTANGNTADIDVSTVSALEVELKVSAVSGTSPTLSVYVEGKFEATGDYKPLVYQENITATGIWYLTITQLAFRYIRVRWAVGGTSPSFTITVAGQAMV